MALIIGLPLSIASGFATLVTYASVSDSRRAYDAGEFTDGTWFAAILFLHVCLILVSLIGLAFGRIALAEPNADKPLAWSALAVNLILIVSLIITVLVAG